MAREMNEMRAQFQDFYGGRTQHNFSRTVQNDQRIGVTVVQLREVLDRMCRELDTAKDAEWIRNGGLAQPFRTAAAETRAKLRVIPGGVSNKGRGIHEFQTLFQRGQREYRVDVENLIASEAFPNLKYLSHPSAVLVTADHKLGKKAREEADNLGLKVEVLPSTGGLLAQVQRQLPCCVIVDLDVFYIPDADVVQQLLTTDVIQVLADAALEQRPQFYAFHNDERLRAAAQAAGFRQSISRHEFEGAMKSWLQQWIMG